MRSAALALLLVATGVHAQGDLLKQVRDSNRAAAQFNQEREQRFAKARDEQAAQLRDAQAEAGRNEGRVASARKRWEAAKSESALLEKKLAAATHDLETLYDAARGAAVDLHDTAEKSLVTAQFPGRMAALGPLAASQTLPGPTELETLWRALQLEIVQSGAVVKFSTDVQTEDGPVKRDVTRVGVFSAIAGGQYLALNPGGMTVRQMEPQPGRRFRRLASRFDESGTYAPMLLDPSRGALLLAEANRPGLFERLWHSGIGGYFIAGILVLAFMLTVVQALWLRSRLIIDEQSIGVTVAVLVAFAIVQWWLWQPGEPSAQENVASVELVTEEPPQDEKEPPPPELTPPPPPPAMPTTKNEALAGLPALAAPTAAPLLSNIQLPVKIAGGGSLTGTGFGGFAKGTGTGAGEGFGRGQGFKGKELIPLSTARPQMPEWACKQNIKGWVEAVYTVMPNGRVQNVKIIDAQPRGVYEIAAIESIGNWIYAETDRAREVKQRVPMDPADCAFNWR